MISDKNQLSIRGTGALTVGAILKEPLETTLTFVSWYLDQGADRIVLFFDDPNDPAVSALEGHEKVDCIRCTRAFWRMIGARPGWRFTLRQNAAMQYLYNSLNQGWFLNVDADELAYFKNQTLAEVLQDQPSSVRSVLIEPAENIQSPDTPGLEQFRIPMRNWICRKVYGSLSSAMERRRGMAGHVLGKSATRVGLVGHTVRQHFLQTPDEVAVMDRVIGAQEGAYLLHFVDQGFEVWRSKLEWRLNSRGFRQELKTQLKAILNRSDPEPALQKLYETMFVFGKDRLALLDAANARLELAIDLQAHVSRHFGQAKQKAS